MPRAVGARAAGVARQRPDAIAGDAATDAGARTDASAAVQGRGAGLAVLVRRSEVVGQVRHRGEPVDGRLLLPHVLRLRAGLRRRGSDAGAAAGIADTTASSDAIAAADAAATVQGRAA